MSTCAGAIQNKYFYLYSRKCFSIHLRKHAGGTCRKHKQVLLPTTISLPYSESWNQNSHVLGTAYRRYQEETYA